MKVYYFYCKECEDTTIHKLVKKKGKKGRKCINCKSFEEGKIMNQRFFLPA